MPSRFRLIISALVILLLIGGMIPGHALAEPVPFVGAAIPSVVSAVPSVGTMVVGGLETVLGAVVIVEIGTTLDKHWDKLKGDFLDIINNIRDEFDKLIYGARWTRTTSDEGNVILNTEEEAYYTAAVSGSPKPGKDKWYHEARLGRDDVEINTDQLTEEQAITKLKNGKDVFTLSKKLARDIAQKLKREALQKEGYSGKYIKDALGKMQPEKHGAGKPGYYEHYHYTPSGREVRLHIWFLP